MPNNPYYLKKQAGFYEQKKDTLNPLFIYQPTPEGVIVLCEHYANKYSIDLRCIDLRGQIETGDNAFFFFQHLRDNPHLLDIDEGQARGLLLSHGQHHAIPVLVKKENGHHHMIVFDSSSGPRIKGYFKMASLFPHSQFHLNNGTRQSDEGSCITDAVCILKEALQIETLIPIIQSRAIPDHPAFTPSRFMTIPKPDNFYVFKMPEALLLTAQISAYLEKAEANQDIIIRGGQSLGYYRSIFSMDVILLKNKDTIRTNINGYLYVKSLEHRNILDFYLAQKTFSTLMLSLELNTLNELGELSSPNTFNREVSASPRISLSPSRISFYSIVDAENSTLSTPEDNFRYRNVSR